MIGYILIVLCIVAVVFFLGFVGGAKKSLPKSDQKELIECVHLWSKWKRVPIDIVHPTTGKKLYQTVGMTRDCDMCGYAETRRIANELSS